MICSYCNNDLTTNHVKNLTSLKDIYTEYKCLFCRDALKVCPNIRFDELNNLVYYYLPFKINNIIYMIRGNTVSVDDYNPINDTTFILTLENALGPLENESYLYSGPFFKPNSNLNQELLDFIKRILKIKYFI